VVYPTHSSVNVMKRYTHRLALGAIWTAVTASTAVAQDHNTDVVTAGYLGTLGAQRIGMTLIVKDGTFMPGSHYFYQKHLTDIPLTGTARSGVTLKEPSGGTFALQFQGNGSNGHEPLTFNNSIAMTGTWTGIDGKSYPVKLSGGGGSGPAEPPGTRWYQDVSSQSDAAFEAIAQRFYNAVMAGDRIGATREVHFPLRVNFSATRHRLIKTPTELTQQWNTVFSSTWLKKAADAMPHDMAIVQGRAMLGDGLAFFGDDGVDVINAEP
jgi:hypothetical protein